MLNIVQCLPESGARPADARHDLDDGVAAPRAPPVDAHPRVDALLSQLRRPGGRVGLNLSPRSVSVCAFERTLSAAVIRVSRGAVICFFEIICIISIHGY